MPEFFQTFIDQLSGSTLNILSAFAILIVGWIVALILAAIVRKILKRTQLDDKIARWLATDDQPSADSSRVGGKAVYYLVMLFVLVAFFQQLGLTMVTTPINAFLTEVLRFAPRLLGAGLITLAAWLIASVLKFAITKTLQATKVEERLRDSAGMEEGEPQIGQSLANAAFWLVFLLFLPAILDALGMAGLVAPVQAMFDQLLSVIPNLIGAGAILLVGWFVARIVREVITNLLAAAGADRLSRRLELKDQKISKLAGTVVHALIMIQVVIAALDTLDIEAISGPATRMLTVVWDTIPLLFGAVLVLGVSYYIGLWVKRLVANLLSSAGFDRVLVWIGLGSEPSEGQSTPSEIVGTLVLVGIMLFAAVEAANLLRLNIVATLVSEVIGFVGQAVLAVIIFGAGMYLANLAGSIIKSTGIKNAKLLGQVTRVAVIFLVIAMALGQLGVATEIVNLAFGLLLGAVAVAIALAFGLGGREIAARKVEDWMASFSDKPSDEEWS
ncbi:MAG: mechanosensitive ion channel [Anaerolineales bacterium]|nr:mechanosensitive ion channel [Anaerolineales bacterium]